MKPIDHNELEQRISRLVHDLPARRAPSSLEARVLAAIAAREMLPWWRKSFSHWPAWVRVLFLGLTATMAAATVWLLIRGLSTTPVTTASELFTAPLVWWHNLNATCRSLSDLAIRALPPTAMTWIYVALGAVGLAYLTLIGAGAAVYRVLRPNA